MEPSVTDRELEVIQACAKILLDDWCGDTDRYSLTIYLRAQLICKGYSPEETDKAVEYFLRC
jgi:hypothetical protein